MKVTPIELVGQKVKIRPMEQDDLIELYNAGNSADIWTYMPMSVQSLDDMKRLIDNALKAREQGTEFPFVIIAKDSQKIVGSTRFLDISTANRSLEIGWTWLSPAVWRTSINTESKYLLLRHCFETLGTIRVQIKTDGRNQRSQKAIERLGAVREGVLRRHRIMYDGFVRDSVYYSIIDQEWQLVKTSLESMMR